MLLRHTTAFEIDRKALTINPAKTCQPIGAMYAALGIHGCRPVTSVNQSWQVPVRFQKVLLYSVDQPT